MRELGQRLISLLQKPAKYSSFTHLCQDVKLPKRLPIFQQTIPAFHNQREIRKIRMSIPRESTNKTIYAGFLRKLYPLDEHVIHEDLYNAYCSLPAPQPLHIEPQHFEHLLCQFTSSGGLQRGKNTTFLVNIISDMLNCDMKASLKEINTYIYLKNYNNETNLPNVEGDYESILEMEAFDISTINVFLKFGLQTKNMGFVSRVLNDIAERDLKFDRMTYQMLISYSGKVGDGDRSFALFENFIQQGYVLDISIVNAVIKSLAMNDQLDLADEIINILFKTTLKEEIKRCHLNNSHLRRQNLQELNYIDSLKIQQEDSLLFMPTPIFSTFSPLLHQYSSLRHFDPSRIFKYLEELNDLGVEVPNSMYIQIFKAFQEQDVKDLDYLKFTLNFLINDKNIKYNRELFDSIIESFLKHSEYQNKMINGIEKQWTILKRSLKNEKFKQTRGEIEEFTIEAINKLMMFY